MGEDTDSIVHDLAKPVQAHGEDVSSLKLRLPTGGDMIRIGNPVLFDATAENPAATIRFDMPILAKMIAHLAKVPTSTVDKLEPADIIGIGWKLSGFFLPKG